MSWRSQERKKRAFFVPLSKGNVFNICVLSQYIVYQIYFQNINIFTYRKTLLHPLLLLVFKIAGSLHCIFKSISICAVIDGVLDLGH